MKIYKLRYTFGKNQFSVTKDVNRSVELKEDPKQWDEKRGSMGPNHGVWEDLLRTIVQKYTQNDFTEDLHTIEEFVDIVRSMLTYRMDKRPNMKDLLPRMARLFKNEEKAQGEPVYRNLMCALKLLGIKAPLLPIALDVEE